MTWSAPEITRTHEPYVGDERTMLEGWLDYHRQTLLLKCAGLTAEQLQTPSVEPSGLTLLGLVRHMAEVERWWFRDRVAGEDVDRPLLHRRRPGRRLRRRRRRRRRGRLRHLPPPRSTPARDGRRRPVAGRDLQRTRRTRDRTISLRWVYVHMIEEYARHNGHADLIRERIDGVTGD